MINQLREKLATFQPKLGFDPLQVDQGSYQWLCMRLGVISASRIDDVLSAGSLAPLPEGLHIERANKTQFVIDGDGFKSVLFTGTKADTVKHVRESLPRIPSKAYLGYMDELISEIATRAPADMVSAKAMEWGRENEPKARDAFAFMTGEVVSELSFIYSDDSMRCGISPDGIFSDTGLEIKCPFTSKVHTATLLREEVKDVYFNQMQFQMYVTGAKVWTFLSYDPRMPSHLMTKQIKIERCEEAQAAIHTAVDQFVKDMDAELAKLGLKFGEQWSI